MQLAVHNRWDNSVQFTAEISCAEDAPFSLKLGLAVRWAYENGTNLRSANLRSADLRSADLGGANLGGADLGGANLRSADLRSANLRSADLGGADLGGANLGGADLGGANLRSADLGGADLRSANLGGANLRSFKADLWFTLTRLTPEQREIEVPFLVAALREGRVDGSSYGEGDPEGCACLIGTLAHAREVAVDEWPDRNISNPAEQWFLQIREGNTPDGEGGGAFAAKTALAWIEEWAALNGVVIPAQTPEPEGV